MEAIEGRHSLSILFLEIALPTQFCCSCGCVDESLSLCLHSPRLDCRFKIRQSSTYRNVYNRAETHSCHSQQQQRSAAAQGCFEAQIQSGASPKPMHPEYRRLLSLSPSSRCGCFPFRLRTNPKQGTVDPIIAPLLTHLSRLRSAVVEISLSMSCLLQCHLQLTSLLYSLNMSQRHALIFSIGTVNETRGAKLHSLSRVVNKVL